MRPLAIIGLALVSGLSSGCSNQPPVYPVHGKITFEGTPFVGGGSISFLPLGDQPGKTAGAEIMSDGSYKLSTHSPEDGSMAGEFRVVIVQVVYQEPKRTEDGTKASRAAPAVPPKDRIPEIYSDTYNSPLKATVEAKSLNTINFDLKRL
jgi:hypothetical protein